MFNSFQTLDRLLRGDSTHPTTLERGSLPIPIFGLTVAVVVLGLLHGFCVGWYALCNHADPTAQQLVSTTVKVPALFLATLLVTSPSLYVFNALVGSRLRLVPLLRLMIATLGVTLAVLASFGPIVAFFSVSTTSYPFMVLLNVVVFAAAGCLGLKFLHQTLLRLSVFTLPSHATAATPAGPTASTISTGPADAKPADAEPAKDDPGLAAIKEPLALAQDPEDLGALDTARTSVLGPHVRVVFFVWMLVFGLVGSQMGWVLRPFIGSPNAEFSWLREREGSFFEGVATAIRGLF